jgi:hypothetical protein
MKTLLRADKCLAFIALMISCFAIVGCQFFPESTFELASESRLPKWVALPPGLARSDASVTMSYYVKPWGRTATFKIRTTQGKTLATVYGKLRGSAPLQLKNPPSGFDPGYPSYEVITANGIIEIIEHRKMEPIFYMTDDPVVWKEIMGVLPPAGGPR